MKKVIKNQKKMKNTMYIVFGVFALALFGVTIINPSYASEGLIIDEALDAIVLYGEVETAKDEEVVEETQDEEENIPAVDNEGDENSKYLEDDGDDNNEDEENLDGEEVDNGENDENEDGDKEGKIGESDKTSETEEVDNQTEVETPEVPSDEENHGVSDNEESEEIISENEQDVNKSNNKYEQSETGSFIANPDTEIQNIIEIESGGIRGEEIYEGVKVEVYAPEGAFPKGTILSIVPITSDDDIEDIQDVLEEQKNVEKTEKLIAFDITFLDPETKEELQPLTGTVQVTFNYEENEELKSAEESEDQEIKVYHLNDKDEEGEKVEEIKDTVVEEVVVNEEKSEEENVMVVEAEVFSIYAIIKANTSVGDVVTITYNANGGKFKSGDNQLDSMIVEYTKNSNGNYYPNINLQSPNKQGYMFAGWYTTSSNQSTRWLGQVSDTTTNTKTVYARWLPFSEATYTISGVSFTMMDRNLGASSTSDYGYYYQWGNNYGFTNFEGYVKNNKVSNIFHSTLPRGPGNYYSSSIPLNDGIWDAENNLNLWGGENTTNSDVDKKGPCPEGYHVPDKYEREYLWNLFLGEYDKNPNYCNSNEKIGECFARIFHLPLPGYIYPYTSNYVDKTSYFGRYWSSTPNPSNSKAYTLELVRYYVNSSGIYDYSRGNGNSVRCFKNTDTFPLIYSGDNGTEDIVYNIRWWEPIIDGYIPSNPIKESKGFLGWYVYEDGKYQKLLESYKMLRVSKPTIMKALWGEINPVYTYDANGGYFENGENEVDVEHFINDGYYVRNTNLQIPNRTGYMFAGWYTTSGDGNFENQTEEWIGQGNSIVQDTRTVYAKWLPFDDLVLTLSGRTITLMDRNLGAENIAEGIGEYGVNIARESDDKLGYYYQRGNNYGFRNFGEIEKISEDTVDVEGYYPGNYYMSDVFIKNDTSWLSNDNPNLWGGGSLANPDSDRQGPCPKGYHIPVSVEMKSIFELFRAQNNMDNEYCEGFNDIRECFSNKLRIPYAGRRLPSTLDPINKGSASVFWLSSYSYSLEFSPYLNTASSYSSTARPVRCFKNSKIEDTIPLIYSGDNGTEDIVYNIRWWEPITKDHRPADPVKNGNGFLGWYIYENGEYGEAFDFSEGRKLSDTLILKARWGVQNQKFKYNANGGIFENGSEEVEINHWIMSGVYERTEDFRIPNRTGYMFVGWSIESGNNQSTEWEGEWNPILDNTKTVYAKWLPFNDLVLTLSGIKITIMDRNLGALAYMNEDGRTASEWKGYYYQRGNNYGFKNAGEIEKLDSERVDGDIYDGSMFYYNSTFKIIKNSPYRWTVNDNKNLWGGMSGSIGDSNKQGPCPGGYHVPDEKEWNGIIKLFKTQRNLDGDYCNGFSSESNCFISKLKLPSAGYRDNSAGVNNYGLYYWSSTSKNEDQALYLNIYSSSSIYSQNYATYRVYGYPVRCFKDSARIIYNTSGGTIPEGPNNVEEYLDSVVKLPESFKTGYSFGGWYTTADFQPGTEIFDNNIFTNDDYVNIYAKWSKNPRYTYDANGGTFPDGKQIEEIKYSKYKNDINIIESEAVDTNIYTFGPIQGLNELNVVINSVKYSSWITINAYSGVDTTNPIYVSDGIYPSNFVVPGNVVTIEVIREGPPLNMDITLTGIIGGVVETPNRLGYTFSGWYETGSGVPFNITGTEVTEDRTLYAKWAPINYSILFHSNTGEDTIISQGFTYDEEQELTGNTFSYRGYTFLGWNTERDGSGTGYTDKQIVHNLTGIENGVINLYAQWKENIYTITYNLGKDEKLPEGKNNPIKYTVNSGDIALINPIKTGYTFIGWTGTEIQDKELNVVIYSGSIGDRNYTSHFSENSYRIVYDKNGGTGEMEDDVFMYTEEKSIKKNKYAKHGYSFSGWLDEDVNILYDDEQVVSKLTGQNEVVIKLVAQWKINEYTITFDTDGGSEIDQIIQDYNTDIIVPNNPTKTGYTFSGWNKLIPNKMPAEDLVIKAQWKINQYKIMFDTDGGNEINPIEKDYNSSLSGMNLLTPTKECNSFSGWNVELPEAMPAHDITLKAIWNYTCSRSSGAGGAKKSETTTREIAIDTNTENEHNSADEKENTETSEENKTTLNNESSNQVISVTQEVSEDGTVEAVVETVKIKNTDIVATVRTEVNPTNSSSSSSSSVTHTKEQNDAYSFAKSNGITTTESIEDAKMNTELTRIQMAKMLSNFAINVLGQEPDTEKGMVNFDDVTNNMDKQYDNAVTKAYQLGIMGQNVKNNEFRPNDTVTRAEFASSLSRLLYHTEEGEYKGTGKYYIPHIAKLYNEGIINKADPNIKEKRGYVMTMLKRTVE